MPNLTHNLLLVGQLVDTGYAISFKGGNCLIEYKKIGVLVAKI